jgi:hypothetical protein
MPKKKANIPILVVPKNATLREIYAKARAEFTAADLQKYTEIEPMVPHGRSAGRHGENPSKGIG